MVKGPPSTQSNRKLTQAADALSRRPDHRRELVMLAAGRHYKGPKGPEVPVRTRCRLLEETARAAT
jgi:hypothetical protein